MDYSNLKNSPLILVIVQVLYDLPDNFDINNVTELRDVFSNNYPTHKQIHTGKLTITDIMEGKQKNPTFRSKIIGNSFTTKDKSKDFQFEEDKFTFNIHDCYSSWEELKKEISFVWNNFMKLVENIKINRISVRSINRIEIPHDVADPTEYFYTSIYSTKNVIPPEVNSYMLSYRYLWDDNKDAIISQNMGPFNGGVFPLIFDIDVLNRNPFDFDEKTFWDRFDEIRRIKDDIFFKNITNKTLDLIK